MTPILDPLQWKWSLSLAVGFALLLLFVRKKASSSRLRLPPGPKPLPIIGNMLDLPATDAWKTYRNWSQVYGDVMYLHIPAQPTVVLGSAKAVTDLMEKRSHIYSDRPLAILDRLTGWDFDLGFMGYTQQWRDHRKSFHRFFNRNTSLQYLNIQTRDARRLAQRVLDKTASEDLMNVVRLALASSILKVVYGMEVTKLNEEYFVVTEKAVEGLNLSKQPGKFPWLDVLPFLRHIPSWIPNPGTSLRMIADTYRPFVMKMRDKPYDDVLTEVANGTANPSMAATLIKELEDEYAGTAKWPEQEELARNSTGVAFASAFETMSSTAQTFLLAMTQFPGVQKKARAELDAQIGLGRFPDHSDKAVLPYIQAIYLETLRWAPVAPLGLQHRVTVDDEYNGYLIPKGTTIIANAWSILHNPEEYPEPESFQPKRFLKDGKIDPNVRDPSTIGFGFGRRVCPGRHFADQSFFLFTASILHVFTIDPILDEHGKLVEPDFRSGLTRAPTTVPCTLSPRSAAAEQLIRGYES